jgi:hypothetical protein
MVTLYFTSRLWTYAGSIMFSSRLMVQIWRSSLKLAEDRLGGGDLHEKSVTIHLILWI